MDKPEKNSPTMRDAIKAPEEYFTGPAWIKTLVKSDSQINCTVSEVTFEPGARNNWHTHPGGQILMVTEGTGYFQRRGQPIELIQPGDTLTIPPDEEHWHGAAKDSGMTHIAINMNSEKGGVVWLKRVTDEEYGTNRKV